MGYPILVIRNICPFLGSPLSVVMFCLFFIGLVALLLADKMDAYALGRNHSNFIYYPKAVLHYSMSLLQGLAAQSS